MAAAFPINVITDAAGNRTKLPIPTGGVGYRTPMPPIRFSPITVGSGTTAGTTTEQETARNYLQGVLDQYGLGSLTPWAYDLLVQGYSIDYILAELRKRPEFRERFPAIFERQARGKAPISPAEYIELERSYDALMRATGLRGFFSRQELYTKWIVGDVSPTEAKARADAAYRAAVSEPIEVRQELARLFGQGAGAVAVAYYLDPKNALPVILRRLQAGEIAGAAIRSTYSLLTKAEVMRLTELGVDEQGAEEGFGALARSRELFGGLPGEAGADEITREEQLAAAFEGNTEQQSAIERQASRRKAVFAGGGGYRVSRTGVTGLGDASR